MQEYAFEESNPFKGIDNPFEEGLQKLKAGDLISAILLFEEAVSLIMIIETTLTVTNSK